MALDISILDNNKFPTHSTSIDIATHSLLVKKIKEMNLVSLLKLQDYYKDSVFSHNEIGNLLAEIEKLMIFFRGNQKVLNILNSIRQLCKQAKTEQKSIMAIAD